MKYIREFNTIEQATASENLIAPGVVFVNDPRLRNKIVTANFEVNSPYNIVQNGDLLKAVNGQVLYLLYALTKDGRKDDFSYNLSATVDGDTVTFISGTDPYFKQWDMCIVASESADPDDYISAQNATYTYDSNAIERIEHKEWGGFHSLYIKPKVYQGIYKIVYTLSTNSYYITLNN